MDHARHVLEHVHEGAANLGLCPPDTSSGYKGLEEGVGQDILQAHRHGWARARLKFIRICYREIDGPRYNFNVITS